MPEMLALCYAWRGNAVLVVHNLGADPRAVGLNLDAQHGAAPCLVNLLSDQHSDPDPSGHQSVVLEPYGYRWYRVGGLDYVLTRSEA